MDIGACRRESNSIGYCLRPVIHALIRAMRLPSRQQFPAQLARAAGLAVSLVLPHRCLSCRDVMPDANGLCMTCWDKLTFLGSPCCAHCGYPFELNEGREALCAACTIRRPAYDRARAVFSYDDHSRDLVLAFKHGDHTETAPALGAWLARAGAALAADADIVAPVPLHRHRLWQRRFNQAALLAAQAARIWDRPYYPDLLTRERATPSQGNLGFKARHRNVKRAFALSGRYRDAIQGQTVLLVDDVFTTGATVEECARVLKAEGAHAVHVVTLARVPKPHTTPD